MPKIKTKNDATLVLCLDYSLEDVYFKVKQYQRINNIKSDFLHSSEIDDFAKVYQLDTDYLRAALVQSGNYKFCQFLRCETIEQFRNVFRKTNYNEKIQLHFVPIENFTFSQIIDFISDPSGVKLNSFKINKHEFRLVTKYLMKRYCFKYKIQFLEHDFSQDDLSKTLSLYHDLKAELDKFRSLNYPAIVPHPALATIISPAAIALRLQPSTILPLWINELFDQIYIGTSRISSEILENNPHLIQALTDEELNLIFARILSFFKKDIFATLQEVNARKVLSIIINALDKSRLENLCDVMPEIQILIDNRLREIELESLYLFEDLYKAPLTPSL